MKPITTIRAGALALAAWAAFAAVAAPPDLRLVPGEGGTGEIVYVGEEDRIAVDLVAGMKLTAQARPSKKSLLRCGADLLAPAGTPVVFDPKLRKESKGVVTLTGIAAPATGTYHFAVRGTDAGTLGLYDVSTKAKAAPKPPKATGVVPVGSTADVTVDALAGSLLTVTVTAKKGGGLRPRIESVTGPDDVAADLSGTGVRVRETATAVSVSKLVLPTFGTWRIRIRGDEGTGGEFTASLAVAPPKPSKTKRDFRGGSGGEATAGDPLSIDILPDGPIALAAGATQSLIARGTWSDGRTRDITRAVSWSVGDRLAARVSNGTAPGVLTGAAAGGTTVRCWTGGVESSPELVLVGGATLTSVGVVPAVATLAKGDSANLRAVAQFSAGAPADVTDLADWDVASGTSVSAADGGVAVTADVGSSSVTATVAGVSGDPCLVLVSARRVERIDVSPTYAELTPGSPTRAFTATATYSDGTTSNVTATCTWATDNAAAATTSGATATRVATGTAGIRALLDGVTSRPALVSCGPVAISSIVVTTAQGAASVPSGATLDLVATATFADGGVRDVTESCTWTSGTTSVVTVSNAAGSHGRVTGAAATGTSIVQAAISVGGTPRSGSLSVAAAAPAVRSVRVVPAFSSVGNAVTVPLRAFATYTDGSTADVTDTATWTSSGPTAATVAAGAVTGAGDGGSIVSASSGGVAGRAIVLGGDGRVSGISAAATGGGAAVGETSGVSATFTFAPDTLGLHDAGDLVDLVSDEPLAVAFETAGAARARRIATATLTANAAGFESAGVAFAARAAEPRALVVFPQTAYVAFGVDTQLAAQLRGSDGFVTDVASGATWTSLQTSFVTIGSTGLAHAVTKGTATVRATASSLSGDGTVAVSGDVPSLSSSSPTSVLRGATGVVLTLQGTALDGLNPSVTISGSGVTIVSGPTPNGSGTQATVTIDIAANAATGLRDVTYGTVVGSSTLPNAFQIVVPAPTFASISPSNVDVPVSGSTQTLLTVTGTGFTTGDTFALTSHTGTSLGAVTVVNSTTMTAQLTVQSTAARARLGVTVQQSVANGGAIASRSNALKIGPADPIVTAVSPSYFLPGQAATTVHVTGTGFQSGISVTFPGQATGGFTTSSVTRNSTTDITFTMSVAATAGFSVQDLVLQNTGDLSTTVTGAFAIVPRDPTISSFSVASLARGASGVSVTVTGTNFRTGAGLSASGTGVTFSNVVVVNPERITASVAADAAATLGTRSVTVSHASTEGGRGATRASAFAVVSASPTVTGIVPGKIGRTGTGGATRRVPVTVAGTNFSAGATVSLAKTSGSGLSVATGSVTVLSSTSLTCSIDVTGTATTGFWDVTVTNPSGVGDSGSTGAGRLEVAFETALAVNVVTPSSGSAFGGERVTIEGSGFQRGCRVEFGTEKAAGVQYLDQNTIVCTVPRPATPSSSSSSSVSTTSATPVDVKVTNNPGGSSTNATLTNGWSYGIDDSVFTIVASSPPESTTAMPVNQRSVVLRLSAPANPSTVTVATSGRGTNCYWFQSGGSYVTGQTAGFGADPRFLVFSRTSTSNFTGSATYVAEIATAVKSSSGRALTPAILASSLTYDQWAFGTSASGTDTTAPSVSTTVPGASATGVGTALPVTVTFSEAMDPLTVTSTSVQLKQGTTALAAVLTLSDDLTTVTITPTEELARSTTYTISVASSVADLCGNTVSALTRTFTTSATDTTAPTIDGVVLADLPSSVDGSGTYVETSGVSGNAFDAYLPTYGWTVRVRFSDAGDGPDPSSFSARANCAVGSSSANAELASKFTVTASGASWTIASADALAAQDDVTFTFTIRDKAGNLSSSSTVTFDTFGLDSTATGGTFTSGGDHDPFDSRESWLLRFDVDRYAASFSTTGTAPSATQQCTTTGSSNGTPDVAEALVLCGLQTSNMTTSAAAAVNGSSVGTNDIVMRLFQERVRATLRARFGIGEDGSRDGDDANVEFLLPGEQGSLSSVPSGSANVTATSGNAWSEMDIGGDTGPNSSTTATYGTLGIAYFDLRNRNREVNLNTALPAGNNNGIFCINMFKSLSNVSRTGTSWGVAVTSNFLTAKGGTPVGEGTLDHVVLADTFDRTSSSNTTQQNDRWDRIMDAIELAAMSVSGVTAHEIGHSVGLVPDSRPKTGFFGNAHYSNTFTEATSTTTNTTHHLDFLGNDVMAAASSIDDRTATGTDFMRFSPMDRNYLLHRQIHDEGK